MRRVLSIVWLLAFLLEGSVPLLLAATTNAESRLPACCRRHGQHHCAMYDAWLRARHSPKPGFTAPPAHCPLYPQSAKSPMLLGDRMALLAAETLALRLGTGLTAVVVEPSGAGNRWLPGADWMRAPPYCWMG